LPHDGSYPPRMPDEVHYLQLFRCIPSGCACERFPRPRALAARGRSCSSTSSCALSLYCVLELSLVSVVPRHKHKRPPQPPFWKVALSTDCFIFSRTARTATLTVRTAILRVVSKTWVAQKTDRPPQPPQPPQPPHWRRLRFPQSLPFLRFAG
jgi:hypothetical protein